MSDEVRPLIWWSPTEGLIEQVEPRWPGDVRYVRQRNRHVTEMPRDAVEMTPAPSIDRDKLIQAVLDRWVPEGMEPTEDYRGMAADAVDAALAALGEGQ